MLMLSTYFVDAHAVHAHRVCAVDEAYVLIINKSTEDLQIHKLKLNIEIKASGN